MTIFKMEWKTGWISLMAWSVIIGFLLAVCILIYPDLASQMEGVSSMFANMGQFSAAFGMDQLNFGTFFGFFSVECGNILGLCGSLYASVLGISALSKEENGHYADFLYTHPVKRTKVILEKLMAGISQLLALDLICFAVIWICMQAIHQQTDHAEVLLMILANFVIQLEIFCICFGLSSFLVLGKTAAGLGVCALLYFLNLFANIQDSFSWLHFLSPFALSDGVWIQEHKSLDPAYLWISLAVSLVFAGTGFWHFGRKDLAA